LEAVERVGVHVVVARVDVDEDGRGAQPRDAAGGGEEAVGRGDHAVAGPDIQRHQREQQRIRAGGHADGVRRAQVRAQVLLEVAHRLTQHEGLRAYDLRHCLVDLRRDPLVLSLQVDQRDFHAWTSARRPYIRS
jgi:hypothetical protein